MKGLARITNKETNTSDEYMIYDIVNVLYTHDKIVFVKEDGTSMAYKHVDSKYQFTFSII